MSDRRHFEIGGADYAKFRPTYPDSLAAWLASIAPATDSALDVGCGTGQLAVLLAEHFGQVVATDVSADQIGNAVAHPRITYRVEPAEEPRDADHSFALVAAGQAAHWFDLSLFFDAARRVAVPDGVVALVTYGVVEASGEAGALISEFYWEGLRGMWPAERAHVETGYRDIEFPFPEVAVPELWIERAWTADEFLGYVSTWSGVKRLRNAGRGDELDAFAAALRTLAGDVILDVRFPVLGRVGRVN
ncbi:MAG: class I SAM-dependent methyltransferase [Actinomycetota bacterium]